MILPAIGISLFMMMASGISAVTGFGTSTISIPFLLLFFQLPQTLLFVGIIRMISSIWKVVVFKKTPEWSLVLYFGIPGILASLFGARLLLMFSEYLTKHILGIFLLAYVFFIVLRPQFKFPLKPSAGIVGGVLSGFSSGVFGVSGPIQSSFLSAFDLSKATYILTVTILDLVIDISRLSTYVFGGITLFPVFMLGLVLSIPSLYFGAFMGKHVLSVIPQQYFRLLIMISIAVVGIAFLF